MADRALRTLDDFDWEGRTALVRADLNVPVEGAGVIDDFRIRKSLSTLKTLRGRGASVVVCSHLGRPQGADPTLSMKPVGARLAELGDFEVRVAGDVGGAGARRALQDAGDAVVLLENTRFEEGEKTNAAELSDRLAGLADLFVFDAFGTAHRAHASTVGVAERLPSAIGLLVAAELRAFDRILEDPARPFVVLLGGAKVSDKIGVVRSLLPRVDVMLVGGAMCFTLLRAEGFEIGESLAEPDLIDEVREVLASQHGARIALPRDVVVADRFAGDAPHRTVPATDLPEDGVGVDVGPETVAMYGDILAGADTVFWNGPMGVAEWDAFAAGTRAVAEAVSTSPAYTVVGGGDSVAALRRLGLHESVDHLSTGGGAGLRLIEQGRLVAVEAVRRSPDGS